MPSGGPAPRPAHHRPRRRLQPARWYRHAEVEQPGDMFDHGSDERIPAGVGERRSRGENGGPGLTRQVVEAARQIMQNRPFQVGGRPGAADGTAGFRQPGSRTREAVGEGPKRVVAPSSVRIPSREGTNLHFRCRVRGPSIAGERILTALILVGAERLHPCAGPGTTCAD